LHNGRASLRSPVVYTAGNALCIGKIDAAKSQRSMPERPSLLIDMLCTSTRKPCCAKKKEHALHIRHALLEEKMMLTTSLQVAIAQLM
jgi:hypothetical protein